MTFLKKKSVLVVTWYKRYILFLLFSVPIIAFIIASERGKDVLIDELQFMYHRNGQNKGGTKTIGNVL